MLGSDQRTPSQNERRTADFAPPEAIQANVEAPGVRKPKILSFGFGTNERYFLLYHFTVSYGHMHFAARFVTSLHPESLVRMSLEFVTGCTRAGGVGADAPLRLSNRLRVPSKAPPAPSSRFLPLVSPMAASMDDCRQAPQDNRSIDPAGL